MAVFTSLRPHEFVWQTWQRLEQVFHAGHIRYLSMWHSRRKDLSTTMSFDPGTRRRRLRSDDLQLKIWQSFRHWRSSRKRELTKFRWALPLLARYILPIFFLGASYSPPWRAKSTELSLDAGINQAEVRTRGRQCVPLLQAVAGLVSSRDSHRKRCKQSPAPPFSPANSLPYCDFILQIEII